MKLLNKIFVISSLLLIIFMTGCTDKAVQEENDVKDFVDNNDEIQENLGIAINLEDYDFQMITPNGCFNKCGDGICDMLQCLDYNCTCEENSDNCPTDC